MRGLCKKDSTRGSTDKPVLPAALAQAFDVEKGEEFEWIIEDKNLLLLQRSKSKKKFVSKKIKDLTRQTCASR
jgi:antitoxin component of MazEF toxin-antitoxin module